MLTARPIELRDANDFVAQLHRHHDPVHRDKLRVAAYDGDRLVGVAQLSALQAENAELREENGCLQHNVAAMQATLDQQAKNCEKLLAEKGKEIERVEAERDAAAKEIPHTCMTCAHGDDDAYCNGCNCDGDQWDATEDKWTWHGAQGEG